MPSRQEKLPTWCELRRLYPSTRGRRGSKRLAGHSDHAPLGTPGVRRWRAHPAGAQPAKIDLSIILEEIVKGKWRVYYRDTLL